MDREVLMLAAVLQDLKQLLQKDVETPIPQTGEVEVRIKSCKSYATDYKVIKDIRRNVSFPLIPGHEPAGIVHSISI